MSRDLFFGFYNDFDSTLGTGIDLTTRAGKAIATAPVGEVAFNGGATVMTENYFNQFIHTKDESDQK